MSNPNSVVSPLLFFETVNAYQRTAAIKAAVELDLFTAVGEGNTTPRELAARCGASERGLRILCDGLTAMGFLQKVSGHYALTPDSEVFLDRRSPAYLGSAVEFLLSPVLTGAFENFTDAVGRGGTVLPQEGSLAPEHPVWVSFARAMAPMMALPAELITNLVNFAPDRDLKVLDIAAGHGTFGIAFARKYPRAEVYAADWPNVLEVARENAEKAGVGGRFHELPGDAFQVDYGDGYDLALLTNFLHHFDPPTCETLLRKVRAALKDEGAVITLEFVPEEDRAAPPVPAMFALVMLASTPAGDAYTFTDLEGMFRRAGFSQSELRPLPPTPQQAVVSRK